MPLFCRRLIDRVLVTFCLLAGLGSPGCGWLTDGALRGLPLPPGGRSERADQASQTSRPPLLGPTAGPSADRAVLACGSDTEHRSVWIRAVWPAEDDSVAPGNRWVYPALEELLARPPDQPSVGARRPNWHRYLADEDPIVAANAAVALARSGDDGGAERLAETARTPGLNQPLRCAAIEALAGLTGPSVLPLLRGLLDQYGRPAPGPRSTYQAELHAELIRGLARHVDPADDPHFVTALHSGAADVRLEALRAWGDGRGGSLPVEVADLRTDADRDVRAAALKTLARRRHPQAHQFLAAALQDNDLTVRTAAIAGLGELGGTEARATLEGLLQDQPEAIRAAAVAALARSGAEQAVLRAAEDRSWRVRLKVARALACPVIREGSQGSSGRLASSGRLGEADSTSPRGEADRAAAVARQLLQDPSPEVQREMVLALAGWPLSRAGPLLLEAMGSRSLMTRRTAADDLAARWPPATGFPVEGPPERQAGVLEELKGRFRQQFRLGDRAGATEAAAGGPPVAGIDPRLLDQVEQLVRQRDVRGLVDFGPGLVDALERLVFDRQQTLPEVVYREVLPRHGTVFAALNGLANPDVLQRRRAAGQLADLAPERPLGRLAVARLAQLVVAEPDPLVWQRVLTAVADDASEPSIRLAYAALSHPSAEVRRRACDHLAAHPHRGHAKVLVQSLDDQDHAVVRAAVRALGTAGRLDGTLPSVDDRNEPPSGKLRRLLATTDESLRLETAVALIRLGDPAGRAALQRLAYSADPKVRFQVAAAMTETADDDDVPTLIRLLDDSPAACRAALEGLAKAVGHDVGEVSDAQRPENTSERVRRWKQWFERREEMAADSTSIGPD